MRTLAAAHVPTRIQVKVEFLRGVQSSFERENGDLMLVTDYAASPYLHEEALPAMDCVLCAGRSHALAKAKRVSLAQLQEHVELSVQHSSEEQGYDRHLFGCERAFFLSSHHTKKEALLMGVGFGWMPLYLVHSELKSGALREVKYQGGSWYRFTPRLVHRSRPLNSDVPGNSSSRYCASLPGHGPGCFAAEPEGNRYKCSLIPRDGAKSIVFCPRWTCRRGLPSVGSTRHTAPAAQIVSTVKESIRAYRRSRSI